jgi:hypothetical protein
MTQILSLFTAGPVMILITLAIPTSSHFVSAQEEEENEHYNPPTWLQNTANWAAKGQISESTFIAAYRYAIQHGWLQLEPKEEEEGYIITMTPNSQVIQSGQPKNCQDMSFPRVDWSGCNFSGINLSHADLHDSNLTGINLSGADLQNAGLGSVIFKNANLAFANLSHADLGNADLIGANLTNADLTGAVLAGANLHCIGNPVCIA